MLRQFVAVQVRRHGVRRIARAWGVGHETLRKFALGITLHPHPRQRERYGERFLEHHPAGYVAERGGEGPHALRPLKMLLPPGREDAVAVVERIFALAAAGADAPAETAAVGAWVLRVLDAEYRAEMGYSAG